jgi:uncharacterized membrane protein (UPF0127 family)
MVFIYQQAGYYAFSMTGAPVPLNGVWVGSAKTVIGRWHGAPNSATQHIPPAPVTMRAGHHFRPLRR